MIWYLVLEPLSFPSISKIILSKCWQMVRSSTSEAFSSPGQSHTCSTSAGSVLDNTFRHNVAQVRDALLKQHTFTWFKPKSSRFQPCENLLVFHFLYERFPYTMTSSKQIKQVSNLSPERINSINCSKVLGDDVPLI